MLHASTFFLVFEFENIIQMYIESIPSQINGQMNARNPIPSIVLENIIFINP